MNEQQMKCFQSERRLEVLRTCHALPNQQDHKRKIGDSNHNRRPVVAGASTRKDELTHDDDDDDEEEEEEEEEEKEEREEEKEEEEKKKRANARGEGKASFSWNFFLNE
eukprot:jgi/Bigna1/125373/aug1.1_g81